MDHAWGYGTDRRLRERNEDHFGVFHLPSCTIAVVCDGMGGHAGGDQASAIAVKVIHDSLVENPDLPLEHALTQAVQAANHAIYETSRKIRRLLGMGTTVAAVAVRGGQAWVAHVGDSRVYRVRDGRSELLTRDHTMVNLFVDAELLSPEDAHSHPEAHILARSVGVDRHVDVDVSAPFDVRNGDILLACSDGVHGRIEDDEFAEAEWTSPQLGVDQLLKVVRAREGDDNATVAAIGVGMTHVQSPPPTEVPQPESFGNTESEHPSGGVSVATPVPQAPRPAIRLPQMGGNGGAFELKSATGARPPQTEAITFTPSNKRPPQPSIGKPQPELTPAAPPPAPQQEPAQPRSRLALYLIAALGASTLVLIGGYIARVSKNSSPEPSSDAMATVQLLSPGDERPGTLPLTDDPEPTSEAIDAAALMVVPDEWSFHPELARPGRRAPHRPVRYIAPPPGGSLQLEAVLAARNRECPEAHKAVEEAMRESTDYAALYSEAWTCFTEAHQIPLARSEVDTVGDFSELLVHYQGFTNTDAEAQRLPEWQRPARGGIEYRLEALLESNEDDLFADVVVDRFGGPALAESLENDVALEAQAALALSQITDPAPEVQLWWARRVYYAARALEGLPGQLIAQYRPAQRETIERTLDAATHGRYRDEAAGDDLPEPVRLALDLGLDRVEAPAPAPAPRPVRPAPAPEPEPDTEAPEPTSTRPVVHRGGENPLPEDLRER